MNRISPFIVLCLVFSTCSPDAGTALGQAPVSETTGWKHGAMATAANPLAVDAALEMLKQGGHAVDAAIAAHAVLGLVEPQSSGLGGGGFMLVYDRDEELLKFYDGREVAPAAATIDMFMTDDGVLGFFDARQSGKAIGVPGMVALYKSAHERHGKLPWNSLFEPAIRLATDGFAVPSRMANFLPMMMNQGLLDENPGASEYFYPGGVPLTEGDILKNPEYANTLRRIADDGPDAFYRGEIAAAIVSAAHAEPNPGSLTVEDLATYEVAERDVICGEFRQLNICTTSPPSSGGAQIMMAVMYDHLLAGADSQADKIAAFVDAQRLAYADRDHYFGDPDEVDIPLQQLLDPVYLQHRATQRIAPGAVPTPGDPGLVLNGVPVANSFAADTTTEAAGTSHLSIIDSEGNAVSLTATVESVFGSQRWAAGFVLNNEMTDFALQVPADGSKLANAVAPGRRPRSSMSPTMVFDSAGDIKIITGSPGGNSIPAYVAKTILGVVDWNLTAQEAVDFPNIIARGASVRVEVGVDPGAAIASDLNSRGYRVQESQGENSGLHIIVVNEEGLDGAADMRREGTVGTLP